MDHDIYDSDFKRVDCIHCGESVVNAYECRYCGRDPEDFDEGCDCDGCVEYWEEGDGQENKQTS